MDITYDPNKDVANRDKHGVSMALAAHLAWDTAVTWLDVRKTYGEPRQCALALLGARVFFVVFVDRIDGRRIISLRKANPREVKRYADND